MCSLIVNSAFAAPMTIVSAAKEFSQDVRFTFLSSNLSGSFYNFVYVVAGNLTRGLDQNGIWLKYEYDAENRLQVIKKDSDNSYVQAFQFGSTNQRLMDFDYGYGYLKIIGAGGAVEYTEFAGSVMT